MSRAPANEDDSRDATKSGRASACLLRPLRFATSSRRFPAFCSSDLRRRTPARRVADRFDPSRTLLQQVAEQRQSIAGVSVADVNEVQHAHSTLARFHHSVARLIYAQVRGQLSLRHVGRVPARSSGSLEHMAKSKVIGGSKVFAAHNASLGYK